MNVWRRAFEHLWIRISEFLAPSGNMTGTQREIDQATPIREETLAYWKQKGPIGKLFAQSLEELSYGEALWWIRHQGEFRDWTPFKDWDFLYRIEQNPSNRELNEYLAQTLAGKFRKLEQDRVSVV